MRIFIFLILMFVRFVVFGQHTFKAIVRDNDSEKPMQGVSVTIAEAVMGGVSDHEGKVVIDNVPDGKYTIVFSFVGYEDFEKDFQFPLESPGFFIVKLEAAEEELAEVVVSATRSSRTILDIPTRVETISGEELGEKAMMRPGDIRMQLNESTGIQLQQTSATSANSTIRIQGLDGRYTQLLKDGFPLYSGFAGGLSIMQIPPLDLRRIEIIKGSSSTLYGGGAIAGLINLVSKTPEEEPELSFMGNVTSAKGLDLSGFYSQKFNKLGITIFAARNTQSPYDPNRDGFSDIPEFQRYTFNPRLFYYLNPSTTISVGINSSVENRMGGDMKVIGGNPDGDHQYFEKNKSERISSQFSINTKLKNKAELNFKNSVSHFKRGIHIPDYSFEGKQLASFSELNYSIAREKMEWITGLNLWTDEFKETSKNFPQRNYSLTTVGGFVQNTWTVTPRFILESGLRIDYQDEYDAFVLPRISALFKLTDKLTSRIGGGLGYKSPTIFTEESEEVAFKAVRPINYDLQAETSIGANVDLNYRTMLFGAVSLSVNQLVYYTQLNNALVLNADSLVQNVRMFENADGIINSRGFETNVKMAYEPFKLFIGYTFIDTKRKYNNLNNSIPRTPKHKLGLVIMYELEENFRIGYEAYYTGNQYLSNGFKTNDYWIMGLMAEKQWERFSIYLNFENFLDARQSKFQDMYSGDRQSPFFSEIYAPVDGFIMNGGIKLNLL